MCIVVVTTAHPSYPLILLSNRDEFLHRPTAPAAWWPAPDAHILAGRDLHRAEHGTWLGLTRRGRLAALTNFREEDPVRHAVQGKRSRGAIVNAYLRMEDADAVEDGEGGAQAGSTWNAARSLVADGLSGVGGFSLMLGQLRRPGWQTPGEAAAAADPAPKSAWEGLAIVSNRSSQPATDVAWLCRAPDETHALSNAHYGDTSWPKVQRAKQLVADAVRVSAAAGEDQDVLRGRLLAVLARDTLPKRGGEEWGAYLGRLRESIFVPVIGRGDPTARVAGQGTPVQNGGAVGAPQRAAEEAAVSGAYGTQKQSVILVGWDGNVSFFERTLFDERGDPVELGKGDRKFEFRVEGWDGRRN